MCGRYTIRRIDTIIRFGAMEPPPFEVFDEKKIVPRFNIAPSQDVPIIRMNSNDVRAVGLVRWGLIPSWTKGKPKLQPINARAETVGTSGMFRQAFERRRCLIPADGFYEWKKLDPKTKQPMFIHMKDDQPFTFAGLWERWKPEMDVEPIDTCTIITTTPNTLMADIHDRMPVILPPDNYAKWLSRDVSGKDVIDLIKPFDADLMEAWPVSTQVNSPRNEGPELAERV